MVAAIDLVQMPLGSRMNTLTILFPSPLKQSNGYLMGYTQVTLLQVIACILISLLRISHPYSTSQGARHAVVAAHIC